MMGEFFVCISSKYNFKIMVKEKIMFLIVFWLLKVYIVVLRYEIFCCIIRIIYIFY